MYTLPERVKKNAEEFLAGVPLDQLRSQTEEMIERYHRSLHCSKNLQKDQIASYLAYRFPATFAAVYHLLSLLKGWDKEFNPLSVCDLGAGPGTGSLAATELFDSLIRITQCEKNVYWEPLVKKLWRGALEGRKYEWSRRHEDVARLGEIERSDLVLLCYFLNEISENSAFEIFQRSYHAATAYLVWVEPGNQENFLRLKKYRQWVLDQGGDLLFPCPHRRSCPYPEGKGWCHFSIRLERSWVHRQAKKARLSYEDEKFVGLVVSKKFFNHSEVFRVVGMPKYGKGHVSVPLCKADGSYESKIFSEREKEKYIMAKKLEWGSVGDRREGFFPEGEVLNE